MSDAMSRGSSGGRAGAGSGSGGAESAGARSRSALAWGRVATPLGALWLASDGDAITATRFDGEGPGNLPASGRESDGVMRGVLRAAIRQLGEWIAGTRITFDVPLAPAGTAFQRAVWAELVAIPSGTTSTYGDIARRMGHPTAVRAVGAANGRNPIAVFIPCHRVIGASGGLTGYAWGLERKQWLLDHERALAARR